nr:translation initiation factor IF-2 [Clostridium sp.]MCM1444622.1 translation initiation factor IF-2 [Candidatus Amulumruptor caecigallinarius]
MMSVSEYAIDMNKSEQEILEACLSLSINAKSVEDLLSDEDITILDNYFGSSDNKNEDDIDIEDEDIEDIVEEIKETKKIDVDNSVSKQKLKKKNDLNKNKKDFALKKKEMYKNKEKLISNTPISDNTVVLYKENMTIGELAKELGVTASELVKKLFSSGLMVTINTPISYENAEILVLDYEKTLKREETANVVNFEQYEIIDNEDNLVKRAPVVTIMGHVDHGKTTLLDTIRKSSVATTEAGGITQAISAYQVTHNNEVITFIDTPGHAAFTQMRARGASITDIIIIIVAADDGVMPQTVEVVDHAKAANVPIIVAINKIDKPDANPEKVMTELAELGLTPEEWGGDTLYSKISAKENIGIDELLDNILLIAELNNYKANPNRYAVGTVIESRLDKHLGPIVTALIQNGTLRIGDPVVVGNVFGKIRTLKNCNNEDITSAIPSQPVEITGIDEVATSGDKFMAFESEKQAKSISEERKNISKSKENSSKSVLSLDDLFSKIQEGIKEINVIIKTDVNGSSEAVKSSLEKIEVEGVKVNVIRSSVGAVTESDIVLARASNAIIIGFNVRPNNSIKDYANEQGVEIRLYNIIYKVVEDMEAAMKGMLDPEYEEKVLGSAEVRQLFKFSKVGVIAGSYVTDGIIKRDSKARIIRDGSVIYDGNIGSVQREKDAVKEVKKGLECGITIENYNDIKVGDVIESYEMVEKQR